MGDITSEEIAAIVQRAKCIHSEAEVEEAIDTGQAKSLGIITMFLLGLRCLK